MKHLMFLGIAFAAFHISQAVQAFCTEHQDEGTGSSFIFSLHYDHEKDQCTPFLYKGEGGNANRFINERECMRNCSSNVHRTYPLDASEACRFKKAEGGCSGRFLRYYYDYHREKCKKFIWTGCFGNGNRFTDMDICNKTCAGIHEEGDDPEEDEPDTPIAIICGVLLVIIIVAFIITGILLTIKSQKKKSAKDGKAEKAEKTKKNKKDKKDKKDKQAKKDEHAETPLQMIEVE